MRAILPVVAGTLLLAACGTGPTDAPDTEPTAIHIPPGKAGEAQIAGTGTAIGAVEVCDVEVLPEGLRVGIVAVGQVQTLGFTVRNRRPDTPCVVAGIRLCEGTDPAFSLPEGPYDRVVVAGGAEVTVPVRFAPEADFCREPESGGCIEFELAPSLDGHRSIPLFCMGTEPGVLVSPNEADFGQVRPGCATREREFEVVNLLSTELVFDSLELSGAEAFFLRSSPATGTTIPPGGVLPITVAYRAEGLGEERAELLVWIVDSPEPFRAALRGGGSEGPPQHETLGWPGGSGWYCRYLGGEPADLNADGIISGAAGELRVWVDGAEVFETADGEEGWHFDRNQNAVCFPPERAPGQDALVEVEYQVACISWHEG